ncbi:MAG TPA: hypothetical protein VND93_15340, partial [Myxococcales bacterium]|nr:hypothetical protein [Myxococcales bacterium]
MGVAWAIALGLVAAAASPPAPADEAALAAQESASRAAHRETAQRDRDKMLGHPAWQDEDRRAAGGKDPEHLPLERKHQAALKRLQKLESQHRALEARHGGLERKH